jgi:hypothetical protein
MTITQDIIRYKTKVSHKHVVVIYHRNTPLPKVQKGLGGYNRVRVNRWDRSRYCVVNQSVLEMHREKD